LKTGNVLTLEPSACPESEGSSRTSYITNSQKLGWTRAQANCQGNFLISPPRPRRQKKGDKLRESGWVSDHLPSSGCQISHTTPKFLHGHNTFNVLRQLNLVHTLTKLPNIYFNAFLSSHLRLALSRGVFLSGFLTNNLRAYLTFPMHLTSPPFHEPLVKVMQIMKKTFHAQVTLEDHDRSKRVQESCLI